MKPPREIDGADVVLWAWSEPEPFFRMPITDGSGDVPIHGLAIARYAKSGAVYRFSCDAQWETENDSSHGTVDDAKRAGSLQYDVSAVRWQRW